MKEIPVPSFGEQSFATVRRSLNINFVKDARRSHVYPGFEKKDHFLNVRLTLRAKTLNSTICAIRYFGDEWVIKPAACLALAAIAVIWFAPPLAADETKSTPLYGLTVYAGRMTENDWQNSLNPGEVGFHDSSLIAVALSRRLDRWFDDLDVELEGQIVHHFGDQDHWEFNLPVVLRWRRMPFDDVVDTSIAFGIGPSYASEVPVVEAREEGGSEKWLIHWFGEIEAGPPEADWRVVFRLHHRSDGFGLIADSGGSNFLAFGIKWRF